MKQWMCRHLCVNVVAHSLHKTGRDVDACASSSLQHYAHAALQLATRMGVLSNGCFVSSTQGLVETAT